MRRIFWQNDSSGVNQRPDFYSTIAAKVNVYRQDIDHISTDSITLAASQRVGGKSQTVPVDILVFCTGWAPISPLYAPPLAEELGLPVKLDRRVGIATLDEKKDQDHATQSRSDAEDQVVLDQFPLLDKPPTYKGARPSHTPFRLYRAMVPDLTHNSHSVIFLGKMVVGNNFRAAEVQALWAVAYLDGNLHLDKLNVEREINETVAWCRRRYLNKGQLGSWFYFDVIDYTDMLLAQLGLNSHRQKGWLKNLFAPCKSADLKSLVEEYKASYPSQHT